jgi:hypothetical protein
MALCIATQEVVFLKLLLTELSIVFKYTTSIMDDNKGCIYYAKSSMTKIKIKAYKCEDAFCS